jgi:cytochrome c-type biogenesis protein CcmH/NrfG
VTLTPDDPEAHFALAFAYAQTGRQEKAIQVLERVLELQPEHPRAREFLQQLR